MSVSAGPGVVLVASLLLLAPTGVAAPASSAAPVFRIARVVDGDTVDLTNGAKVRLVQIDTPEVYFSPGVLRTARLRDREAAAPTGNGGAARG